MDVHRVLDIQRVTSGQNDGHRDPQAPGALDDELVPLFQPRLRQRQSAELVLFVGVGPSQVENDIRPEILIYLGDARAQLGQVLGVAVAGPETDVDRAQRLFAGIDVHLVDGQGEDLLMAGQGGGRAVSLVEVAVDDHDPIGELVLDDLARGHGDVVEEAEALAVVGESVVEAAADVDGEAALQGLAGREDGPADREQGEADELGRVTDLEGLELGRAQAARLDPLEVAGGVH